MSSLSSHYCCNLNRSYPFVDSDVDYDNLLKIAKKVEKIDHSSSHSHSRSHFRNRSDSYCTASRLFPIVNVSLRVGVRVPSSVLLRQLVSRAPTLDVLVYSGI